VKSYKVTKSFSILWGLMGIWILLGGTIFSLFIANNPFWGFLSLTLLVAIIYLLASGRATEKKDYSGLELTQRGILLLAIVAPPSVMAIYLGGARPYLIPYVVGIVILFVLMILELRKAEKITPDP
jgi:hypothetical protein